MYGNHKNYRKGFNKGKTKKTPTQKAFSAGVKAGLRMVRRSRSRRF